jgi:transforming growth factor-beta-induced protein
MKKSIGFLSAVVLSVTVVGCSDSDSPVSPSPITSSPAAASSGNTSGASLPTIAGVATSNANFTTLVAALSKAGLVSTFSGAGSFTVFAPTNAAFDAAAAALIGPGKTGQELVDALDVATLTAVLKFHVVGDARNAQAVLASSRIVMLDGNAVMIALKSGSPYINSSQIVSTDIQASNGIVHVIDAVLLPPSVSKSASTSDQTIAAIAVGNPDFSTLVAALQKAGLVSVLNGTQKFTVFAPTNAAFDEAAKQLHLRNGMELVAELDVKTLTAVLTYHVIAGETKAAAVVAADQLHMLSGVAADVALRNGKAYIDDAQILATDIPASNGVIHVLGGVMLPF